jgi:hypothetical protein
VGCLCTHAQLGARGFNGAVMCCPSLQGNCAEGAGLAASSLHESRYPLHLGWLLLGWLLPVAGAVCTGVDCAELSGWLSGTESGLYPG